MRILINGMFGLGDNIYQLGFIRSLAEAGHDVTVCTPWPELYQDIPRVSFQRKDTSLRTQAKNISRVSNDVWSYSTQFDKRISVHYGAGTVIPNDMERIFNVPPIWGLRPFENSHHPDKQYVIIRPVTVRKEWRNEARNPLPEYIDQVSRWLSEKFHVISVADLEDGQEWSVGDLPYADERYHAGELTLVDLLGLCQGASAIAGGVGWVVPFAITTGVPTFVVSGGNGGYNHPAKLINHTMDFSKMKFAVPDQFCKCTNNVHECDKRISNLKGAFDDWQSIL